MSAESEGWVRRPDMENEITKGQPHMAESLTIHVKGEVMAMCNRHPFGNSRMEPDVRWHISVSHAERVPSWEEMADACHAIRPGVPFVMGVPPRSWWLNLHPNVLHLWQTKDDNLIADWRANAMGQQPTSGRKMR